MDHQATQGGSFGTLKEIIAGKLERAAEMLGEQTAEGQIPGPYNRRASELLRHSAERVREFDVKKADLKLRSQIKAHPGQTVLWGLAAGLIVGLWLRRR